MLFFRKRSFLHFLENIILFYEQIDDIIKKQKNKNIFLFKDFSSFSMIHESSLFYKEFYKTRFHEPLFVLTCKTCLYFKIC